MSQLHGYNKRKNDLLGEPHGTAANKLRKLILFDLLKRLGLDICFRCGLQIESAVVLSIEHKIPWLKAADPRAAFFDLENISFSHLSCNCKAAVYEPERQAHGLGAYKRGCRCDQCVEAARDCKTRWRDRTGRH